MVDTPGADASRPIDGLSFEEALQELEGIVRELEGGQGKLEKAVAQYERGAALRRHCETLLAEAEQKVQTIVDSAAGPTLRDAG
jgi:exodeoxyribonuclease VII small subunit